MPGFGFGFSSRARARRGDPVSAIIAAGQDWYGNPGTVTYGRSHGHDAGTDGDLFLDPANGDDTNSGTAPGQAFASWAKAITEIKALTGDRTLRIMGNGAKIRGALACNLLAFPYAANGTVRIKGYGTDLPALSGAKVVPGWSPCTAADAAVVGVNFANIWKASVLKSDVDHAEWQSLLLTENDTPLALTMARGDASSDPFFLDDYNAMYSTGKGDPVAFTLNGAGHISEISLPGVLENWSDAQLARCKVMVHVYPNLGKVIDVASAANGVLQLAPNSVSPESFGGHKFTLLNILPELSQGSWGFRDDGGANLTLYCWPNDPQNLASEMEIAAERTALTVRADATRQLELEGLRIEMASGGGITDGRGIYINTASHVSIRQCEIANVAHREFGYGAFDTKFSSDITIEDVTIRNCQCAFGGFWNASNGTPGIGNRGKRLHIENASLGVLRNYAQQEFALVDIQPVNCCAGAHGNQINWYFACDKVVMIGFMPNAAKIDHGPHDGYVTNNGSSNVLVMHSLLRLSRDGRGLFDQTVQTPLQTPAQHHLINCWVPHESERIGVYSGLSVGENTPQADWIVANSVSPGIANLGGVVTRRNNVLTSGNADHLSEVTTVPSTLHRAEQDDNFLLQAGGETLLSSGYDVENIIQQYEAWFPDIDFRRDGLGRFWDPADPGIGPYGKPPGLA